MTKLSMRHRGISPPPPPPSPPPPPPPPPPSGYVGYDVRYGTDPTATAADGWFRWDATPTRTMHCDLNAIDNSGNGLTPATAKRDLPAAWAAFRSGFTPGDRLRIAGKRSGAYSGSGFGNADGLGGIDAARPTVMCSYDPTDPTNPDKEGRQYGADMPVITVNPAHGSADTIFSLVSANPAFGPPDFIAWQGLHCKNSDLSTSTSIGILGGPRVGIIVQHCKHQQVATGMQGADISGNFSKSAFWAVFNTSSGNASCIYLQDVGGNGVRIEDCVGVRPGWSLTATRASSFAAGGPGYLSHFIYWHASSYAGLFNRLLCIDAGGDAYSFRGSHDASCLVGIDLPSYGSLSSYSSSPTENPAGSLCHVRDVVLMGADVINTTGIGGGPGQHGPSARNSRNGSTFQNAAFFDNPLLGVTTDWVFGYDSLDPSSFTYAEITDLHTYNWSTRVAGGPSDHGSHPENCFVNFRNGIFDTLTPADGFTGTGNIAHSGITTYPNKKTRDEVITIVLNQMGVTPGANYAARKAQLVNVALEYPHLAGDIAKAIDSIGLQSLNLVPLTHAITSAPSISGLPTPRIIY